MDTTMDKDEVVVLIKSILNSTRSSLSISSLNKEFRNETGIDIPIFGYKNISDFLHSLPESIKVTGISPVEQVTLITNKKSGHIRSYVEKDKFGIYTRSSTQSNFCKTNVNTGFKKEGNKNAVGKGNPNGFKEGKKGNQRQKPPRTAGSKADLCYSDILPPIKLELHASRGDYIEIYPCEILSPRKFFFLLRKFKKDLESLENDMQEFYTAHEEIPTLTKSLIKPKQICAAFHKTDTEAKWYRSEIHRIVSDSHVLVNFIDFGSSAEIPKENVKFLHRNFISFPRQACSGFLANIKPSQPSSEWSPAAIERFRDLAFKKDLVAGVVCINTKARCLGLALSFTSGKEIHINDTLVNEGYAEFKENVVIRSNGENRMQASKPLMQESKPSCKKPHNKRHSKATSSSLHPESRDFSQIEIPVFYSPTFYNSNSRLKKMFSEG